MPILSQDLPVISVNTDASSTGYGWYYNGEIVSEKHPEAWAHKHINVLELFALYQFLASEEGRVLENCRLCWRVDNNAALLSVRKYWELLRSIYC